MSSRKHAIFREHVLVSYVHSGVRVPAIIQDVLRRLHQVGMDVTCPANIHFERRGNDAHFYGPSRHDYQAPSRNSR